jgi:hypothetical protein
VETVPRPPLEIKAVWLNSLRRSCGKRSACFCSCLGPPNVQGTIGLPNGWNVNSFPASKVLVSLSESDQCGDRGLNLIVAGVPGAVWYPRMKICGFAFCVMVLLLLIFQKANIPRFKECSLKEKSCR